MIKKIKQDLRLVYNIFKLGVIMELIIIAILIGIGCEQKFQIIQRCHNQWKVWYSLWLQPSRKGREHVSSTSIRRNLLIEPAPSQQLQNQLIQLFDGDRKRAEELVENVRFGLNGKSESYYWSLALQRKRHALKKTATLTPDIAQKANPFTTSDRHQPRPTKANPNLTFVEPASSTISHNHQQRIKLHLNTALDLVKQHKFELALPILNRLIGEYPDCLQARLIRGRALRDLQKYDAALSDFDDVIQQNPHHIAAHRDKGLIEYEQRNYQAAIASLSIVIGHLPSAYLFKIRGNAYKGLGQNEAAIVDYLSAKKIYARQGVEYQVRQIEKQIHILYGLIEKIDSDNKSQKLQIVTDFPFEKGRKIDQQHLLNLLHDDRAKACRLLEATRRRHPRCSINWYFEKTIYDLERDRH
ncbi:MAG: hypothetical protein EAZ61_09790 [Oscillatoriales cyanobacterium]|nr:MAG: hypothetical protein EAZ61_09790 [Oscillatoriales cyanobacterium]